MSDALDQNTQRDVPAKRQTFLTTHDAAEYLGLSASTLNKWRCHGGGPVFVKLGRAVRYRREDLDAFIQARSLSSTSEFSALAARANA